MPKKQRDADKVMEQMDVMTPAECEDRSKRYFASLNKPGKIPRPGPTARRAETILLLAQAQQLVGKARKLLA